MLSRYGALWSNSHGTRPSPMDQGEWGETLGDLAEHELRFGFQADLGRASDFPPSSAKFRAMCRPPESPQSKLPAYQPYVSDGAHRVESDETKRRARQAEGQAMRDIMAQLHIVPDDAA